MQPEDSGKDADKPLKAPNAAKEGGQVSEAQRVRKLAQSETLRSIQSRRLKTAELRSAQPRFSFLFGSLQAIPNHGLDPCA